MEAVAIIPSKRLRNKIAGFSTHLMNRILKSLSVGSHSSCSRRSAIGVWMSCPTSPPLESTASRWVEYQTLDTRAVLLFHLPRETCWCFASSLEHKFVPLPSASPDFSGGSQLCW